MLAPRFAGREVVACLMFTRRNAARGRVLWACGADIPVCEDAKVEFFHRYTATAYGDCLKSAHQHTLRERTHVPVLDQLPLRQRQSNCAYQSGMRSSMQYCCGKLTAHCQELDKAVKDTKHKVFSENVKVELIFERQGRLGTSVGL